jgi:uncharacterized membrane protein YhaH (DUF805 family)
MSNQQWGPAPQNPDPYQQPYQQPQGQPDPYSQQDPYGQQAQYGQQNPYGQPNPYGQNPYPPAPYGAMPGPGGRPRPSVGFGQAIKLFFKNYAVFSGRASRSEYWWVQLFLGLLYIVWTVLFLVAGGAATMAADSDPYGTTSGTTTGLGVGAVFIIIIGVLMYLAVIVPSLAISWRRLHDTDKSGGFYFLSFIPWVGGIILIILQALPSVPQAWQRWDNGKLPVEN